MDPFTVSKGTGVSPGVPIKREVTWLCHIHPTGSRDIDG